MSKMTNAHKLMPCVIAIATLAGAVPAVAEWQFEQGEGQLYAYTTDGGFVQGSYQNAMFFFCQDGLGYCELSITIDGKQPQPRDIATFTFDDGSSSRSTVAIAAVGSKGIHPYSAK